MADRGPDRPRAGSAVEPRQRPAPTAGAPGAATGSSGWEQVQRARGRTRSGADLLRLLVDDAVPLRASRGDASVAAVVGWLAGRPVVAVALAAQLRSRPTPDGYRLAVRAYRLAGRLDLPVLSLVDTPGAEPGAAAEDDGIAPAMGDALDALLTCRSPTVALVHGEGGSGGALAASTADRVLVAPEAYFAAIGPEGAQATLRRDAAQCADLMRITPADLLAMGAADALAEDPAAVEAHLAELAAQPPADRLARRRARWGGPLSHVL